MILLNRLIGVAFIVFAVVILFFLPGEELAADRTIIFAILPALLGIAMALNLVQIRDFTSLWRRR